MKDGAEIQIKEEDQRLLAQAIRTGRAILFLGAGASATCKSADGASVAQGWELAKAIAVEAGLSYDDDDLPTVIGAAVPGRVSKARFDEIIRIEYTKCEPSTELQKLLLFSWRRIYTWNLDDTVANCRRPAQRLKVYNGMSDPVSPLDDIAYLQLIHLHGDAWKPELGYIFSESDYNRSITQGHKWYNQAVVDYTEFLPIFIGSRLREPILTLELDRARPHTSSPLGIAFLITPDNISPIQLENYKSRNIFVIQATLAQFVRDILSNIAPNGLSPTDVTEFRSKGSRAMIARTEIRESDLVIADNLKLIRDQDGLEYFTNIPSNDIPRLARRFLEGSPPTWPVVKAEIPIELDQFHGLHRRIEECFWTDKRLFIVYGQSGSGKTTAVMQSLLKLSKFVGNIPIYEVGGNIPSLRGAIELLSRMHKDEKILVYLGPAFIFGDLLSEDISSVEQGKMLLVGDARTSEWRSHIRRKLGQIEYSSFEFQRFSEHDYEPLSNALVKFVPAPAFHKMNTAERTKEFTKSKSQLLIALKEVTNSHKFKRVISDEYEDLKNSGSRICLLIIGVATLSRTGISTGKLKEAFGYVADQDNYYESIDELAGIVSEDRNDRLVARHEVYVRHILENVADSGIVRAVLVSLLRTYTKYGVPVIKSVSRQDGILFKFCLNHNVLRGLFKGKGGKASVLNIYESFEIEFQRDGHFWLQYGQYLSSIGDYSEALPILEKSIEAYPENDYAAHALADIQLRVAANAPKWDSVVTELVRHAVFTLEELHDRRSNLSDEYPIVTLAERYVEVLLNHKKDSEAIEVAKRYFEVIGRMKQRGQQLDATRTFLMQIVTAKRTEKKDNTIDKSKINRRRTRRAPK